jgi:hypothetical protein
MAQPWNRLPSLQSHLDIIPLILGMMELEGVCVT